MNHKNELYVAMLVTAWFSLLSQVVLANNLKVTNQTLSPGSPGYTYVQATISWDNSWKASWSETNVIPNVVVTNWDAAWIFVKYRVATNNAPWCHASLSITNSEHSVPAQAMVNVGLSTNAGGMSFGCGVFLYRSAEGSGNWTNTVKLRWNTAQDGLLNADRVDVSVHAIEMVYVPQGRFKVGSGGTENGSFTEGNSSTTWTNYSRTVPFAITHEGALTISNAVGCLWGTGSTNDPMWDSNTIGSPGVLSDAYPKGFKAFYCMKYEISQGQWVNFFNMLTESQKTNRDITFYPGGSTGWNAKMTDAEWFRNTIAWTSGDASCTNAAGESCADRACNCLGYGDLGAYFDWAGLRPMTELEYEKACRGPLDPVPNEWAIGVAVGGQVAAGTNFTGGADGSGTEACPTNANCVVTGNISYDNGSTWAWRNSGGPLRCGIFATARSTRARSGATYWGIMEMSGNVSETAVTVADPGRAFAGQLGDGKLDVNGYANYSSTPDINGFGCSSRGSRWDANPYLHQGNDDFMISGRGLGNYMRYGRNEALGGGRGVRQASSVAP